MSDTPVAHERKTLRKQVQDLLREEDSRSMAGSLGLLLAGIGVCLFMGIIVASVIWFVLWQLFDRTFIGWAGWYLVYLLALVPWLAWQDRRNRADYISESLTSADPEPSSAGEHHLDASRIHVGVMSELLTW